MLSEGNRTRTFVHHCSIANQELICYAILNFLVVFPDLVTLKWLQIAILNHNGTTAICGYHGKGLWRQGLSWLFSWLFGRNWWKRLISFGDFQISNQIFKLWGNLKQSNQNQEWLVECWESKRINAHLWNMWWWCMGCFVQVTRPGFVGSGVALNLSLHFSSTAWCLPIDSNVVGHTST